MILNIKRNKNKIVILLSLCFLISLIIINAFPALLKGVDNGRLIKHFNSDEGEIVSFYNDFYKRLFVTPPTIVSYPTMFYYTAGVYLFPYSSLNKSRDNHTVIAVTFRILNTF